MEIQKIPKIQIPKINSLPTSEHVTRQLNIKKPGFDFIVPSYTPIEYNPKKMQFVEKKDPPSPPDPPPPPETKLPGKELIPDDEKEKEIDCPGKDQPYRLHDVRNSKAQEKVIAFEVVDGKCIEIWGPTSIAEKFLPSPSVAATTFGITIVATSAATLTPILTKALKPLFKQVITRVKKLLGKKPKKPTRSQVKANSYREKRGLPPLRE
jgi:hypothetical protein